MAVSIQDRTAEFHAHVKTLSRKIKRPPGTSKAPLLSDYDNADAAPRKPSRSEFARKAAEVGRSINDTMTKLERLAHLARRKTLFDDRPVEIAELTYVIKQDLASINTRISDLQALSRANNPNPRKTDEVAEHSKNVVVMLQGKLADVSVGFKEVLEVRTKNIQAGKARTENFVSSVGKAAGESSLSLGANSSPLYSLSPSPAQGVQGRRGTPLPSSNNLSLSLEPTSGGMMQSQQQLMLLEEGQGSNAYISARSEAIDAIERTINELGGIFGQLAQMVSEQGEMVQRIDQDVEDTVVHIEGAQAELMKYWKSVSSNRMLFLKMFGVLMIFFLLWVLVSG
ncbi:t-SNARE [Ascobolus immersus RN42]|uniref:t-SNARE n=1 Tax=Ascobolus immersus RN42 TaxID=1160509 RepID=A0A3N4I8B4_ASCIM|nr:t-SNARE [Ascobolus immersus RN42]